MPPSGCGTSCRLESSLMAKSTPDQSDLFNPKTSSASISATSSRASGDGVSRPASPDGRMTESYGQALARVSRSVLRASEAARPTSGIYGPTFFGSSVPDGPLSSWESRLRERLAMVGSTESALIWREKRSPAGRSTSRLSRSTPLTSAIASIGSPETTVGSGPWSTPRASDGEKGSPQQAFGGSSTDPLPAQMHGASPWTTPSASAAHHQGQEYSQGGTPLTMQMSGVAPWATPKAATAGPDFAKVERSATGLSLQTQMAMAEKAAWVTPAARDGKGSRTPNGSKDIRAGGQMLNEQMVETGDLRATSGEKPNGSFATTGKRGAPNPAHPLWLMGFGAVFLFLAPTDAPSRRSKAKKPDGSRE